MKVISDWWLLPSKNGWVVQGNCCGKPITTSALINIGRMQTNELFAETLNSQYLLKFPKNPEEIELASSLKGLNRR